MNDRLKYRVWDKQDECYAYSNNSDVDVLYIETDGELTYGVYSNDYEDMSYIPESEVIVEQCTGLKDKNGKLIYEGDIVRVIEQCMTNTLDRNYPMLFNEKVAKFGFKHPDGHFFYFTNNEDFCYEVIGNIHENADLLGEE